MRIAVRQIIDYSDRDSFRESERCARVEDQLRTYMLNGTEPAEIEEQMRAIRHAYLERCHPLKK